MNRLMNGQKFPALELPKVGGGLLKLPEALAGSFGVVLVYRGDWCPFCNKQLAAFERAAASFEQIGIKTAALSADTGPIAAGTVEKHKIRFPVGHSADIAAVSKLLGTYTNDQPPALQTSGFVLAPDGSVVVAVYSSSAIGRLVPEDVAGLVSYIKSKA